VVRLQRDLAEELSRWAELEDKTPTEVVGGLVEKYPGRDETGE
jgi:hypothetical protein